MHGCLFIKSNAYSKQGPLTDSPNKIDPGRVPPAYSVPEALFNNTNPEIRNRTLNDNFKNNPSLIPD